MENIFKMLKPGGHFVFSEGVPEICPGREWCLSPLFGFFDGWWDRGGFLSLGDWSAFASAASFSIAAREPIPSGPNTLGNLVVCRKDMR